MNVTKLTDQTNHFSVCEQRLNKNKTCLTSESLIKKCMRKILWNMSRMKVLKRYLLMKLCKNLVKFTIYRIDR